MASATARVDRHGAGRASLFEGLFVADQNLVEAFGVFVTAALGLFLDLAEAAFDRFEVFQLEFRVDDLLVAHRIDRSVDVGDVAVFEAAQHVDDGVGFTDVGQKLVAEAFAFRGPFDQTGDVHDLDGGRYDPFRIVDLDQFVESLVGDGDHAHVRLDGAERKVRRLGLSVREAVEKRGFAYVRQAHDAALECHGMFSL